VILRQRRRKRLPHAALLVLSLALAGAVTWLTWPTRGAVFCEQLPELTALAVCAATLFVFSFRALAATGSGEDRRTAGASLILAALAFFLAVHFVAEYRQACRDVQRSVRPGG
jgi:TRAP-type uncharacterized transport system fused permease subunit